MQILVNGILTDYEGRVLLEQCAARELAPVQRPLSPGLTPTATLDRAFRESTGLIVLPVRLTGLHYDGGIPGGELSFSFRCTMRGGDLLVPDGGRPAGFFDCPPLPDALSPKFRRQLDAALHHPGGPPALTREGPGLGRGLARLFGRREPAAGPDDWSVAVRVVGRGPDGRVAWTRGGPDALWGLPAAAPSPGEAPWETAKRLLRPAGTTSPGEPSLVLVELAARQPALVLVFDARLDEDIRPALADRWIAVANGETPAGPFDPADARLIERPADAPQFIVAGDA